MNYRGRIAPSPTGLLHIGHACTFWTAYQRAVEHRGTLLFRDEDLDPQRSKASFATAMIGDLRWLGIEWQEGPDVGGGFGPYEQVRRRSFYLDAWRRLRDGGHIYPCSCSRKDLALAAAAPNEGDDEPMYPGRCRERIGEARNYESPVGVNWRFRRSRRRSDHLRGPEARHSELRRWPGLWRLCGLATRRCSRVSARGCGRRRSNADHGSRSRRRSAEVHSASIAADSRARVCDSCLLSLRPGSRRIRYSPGQAQRCTQPARLA